MITKTKGFTGNQLKIFALICMTIDHVGVLLLPQYPILRYIGRLSMPIFAWMLSEGCQYTRNRFRHVVTIGALAALCQAVYYITDRSLEQCILVTFTLSVLLIYALDYALKRKHLISGLVLGAVLGGVIYLCFFLPGVLPGFHIDYGFFGVVLPAVIYMGHTKEEKLFGAACCMTGIVLELGAMQWYSFAALPIICLYGGRRGTKKLKYLFYIYYPLHLATLYGIDWLLNNY